jgi:hypothetical protein
MAVISSTAPNPAPEIVSELRRQGRQTTWIAVAALLVPVATLVIR